MTAEKEVFERPDAALIYCRVSGKKQDDEGSGLDSQEHRCRERANALNCPIEAVFPDIMTGKGDFMNRRGMVALLAYLDANPHKRYVVIFDDLKRYSRDTEFHLRLRREMQARNAIRDCLNFKFEDSPEGKFLETIIAATGTLEREQNARQTLQKMKARMEQGFWVFQTPKGYKYQKSRHSGKEIVPDEPIASIIMEAFEAYACGRLESQAEVKRYLESQPAYPKNRQGYIPQQRVTELLTNPLYAGFINHERYGIKWLKGHHQPLISLETFEKVQARRETNTNAPIRKNINLDFPLRGFVLCGDCDNPFTACWSKGKRKKYPYYLCDTRGCESYRKSVPRAVIEGEFETIIKSLQPTKQLFDLATIMFKQAWNQRLEQAQSRINTLKSDLKATDKEIAQLLDRAISASNATVIAAYEGKIEKAERTRQGLLEKLASKPQNNKRFEEFIEHSLKFLANPWKLWASGRFDLQRTVVKLAFSQPVTYDRNKGYRTPKTTLPFKMLQKISDIKSDLVRTAGLEPAWAIRPRDFLTNYDFHRHSEECLWSGLYLHPNQLALGAARLVSTPSEYIGLARDCQIRGFPEFEQFYTHRFQWGTQLVQVPCVYQFHHVRDGNSLSGFRPLINRCGQH